MSIENFDFRIPAKRRGAFIEQRIAANLPPELRDAGNGRANKIVADYAGREEDAMTILLYAAGQGRFGEFAEKLETYYEQDVTFRHSSPEERKRVQFPGAVRVEEFFSDCYNALDR